MRRRPDEVEIQIGVRFDATVGMVIANTSAGGHLDVTLRMVRKSKGGCRRWHVRGLITDRLPIAWPLQVAVAVYPGG